MGYGYQFLSIPENCTAGVQEFRDIIGCFTNPPSDTDLEKAVTDLEYIITDSFQTHDETVFAAAYSSAVLVPATHLCLSTQNPTIARMLKNVIDILCSSMASVSATEYVKPILDTLVTALLNCKRDCVDQFTTAIIATMPQGNEPYSTTGLFSILGQLLGSDTGVPPEKQERVLHLMTALLSTLKRGFPAAARCYPAALELQRVRSPEWRDVKWAALRFCDEAAQWGATAEGGQTTRMEEEVERLKKENSKMQEANAGLEAKARELQEKSAALEATVKRSQETQMGLETKLRELQSANAGLEGRIRELQEQNARAQAEIQRLAASPPVPPRKSVDELAHEVLRGVWKNYPERKRLLTDAGYNYDEVQHRVNELVRKH